MFARELTCLTCSAKPVCPHYGLGKIGNPVSDHPGKKLKYKDVYTDSEDEISDSPKVDEHQSNTSDLNVNDWCLVKYDKQLFPGEILRKVEPNQVEVSCMVKAGNYWKWPTIPDILVYSIGDIKCKLFPPQVVNARGHYKFLNM